MNSRTVNRTRVANKPGSKIVEQKKESTPEEKRQALINALAKASFEEVDGFFAEQVRYLNE